MLLNYIRNIFFSVTFLVLLLSSNNLYASYADTYGFSASGIARGNAVTATVNDWSSVYYNMAGLGKTIKNSESNNRLNGQLGISYLYAKPSFDIDINREIKGDKNLDVGRITFGLAADLKNYIDMPESVSSARFGIGIGISSDLMLVKLTDIDHRTHNFFRYGREIEMPAIFAGVGFGFKDDKFGVGIGTVICLRGEGPKIQAEHIQLAPEPDKPMYNLPADVYGEPRPVIGLYYSPSNSLDFGFSFRGEQYLELDPLKIKAGIDVANVDLDLSLALFDYYTPNSYTFGVAYTPKKHSDFTFSFDIEFQQWSENKISPAKEDYWIAKGYDFIEFDDILIPKIGLSYKISNRTTFMAGYYMQPSCIDDDEYSGLFNYLDNDMHAFSWGLKRTFPPKWKLVKPFEINVAMQYQYLKDRAVRKKRVDNSVSTAEGDSDYYWDNINPDYEFGGDNFLVAVELVIKL